jgi:hypothetical protein
MNIRCVLSARLKPIGFCLLVLAMSASAQENCGYPASMLKSGFEDGEQPATVSLPPDTTPLALTVDYPVNNLTVGSDVIQMYGTYVGPANTGITTNDTIVATNSTQFVSPPITLIPGSNTVTVVGTTLDGTPITINRTVTLDVAQKPDVELRSDAFNGYAPAQVGFSLAYRIPAGQTTLTRFEIDYNGDGINEVDAATVPAPLRYAYGTAGLYIASVRMSFDDGNMVTPLVVRTSSWRVLLTTLAFTRQTLCGLYYGMKQRLLPGQSGVTNALRTLTPALRSEFQTIWTGLGATLGTTASQLGEIVDGQISDVTAEFQVAIPDPALPGEFFGFPVVMRRGTDGVWRISEM